MKEEIAATVFFVTRLAKKHGTLNRNRREKFAVELTSVLFENYKSHWYPENPAKGQGFRCLRMNKAQVRDPVLEQACRQSDVDYEDLGLPKEITIWVDPFAVSCRWHTGSCTLMPKVQRLSYGEKSTPFSVAQLERRDDGDFPRDDGDFSRRINSAVEKASSDYHSGTSSDEESGNVNSSVNSSVSSGCSVSEPKTIPTVSNPNSVYQAGEFTVPPQQSWSQYQKRKVYPGDGYQQHQSTAGYYAQNKTFKNYRPSFAFSGPRVDRYHWVSKNRS